MTFKENIHEGVVCLYVECDDPEDIEYNSGCYMGEDILKKYDLKSGDGVQYKILKNRDVKIVGRIRTTKVITPI